jgi:SAM-dependent methyltransferase
VHAGDVYALAGIGPYAFHHVFEHLRDPAAALRSLRGILAPDGRLVLVYRNPRLLARWVYGRGWPAWEAPRHLVLPPPASMAHAARRAELRVVRARTTARFALPLFYRSRHGHERGRTDLTDDETRGSDRVLASVERGRRSLPIGSRRARGTVALARSDGTPIG